MTKATKGELVYLGRSIMAEKARQRSGAWSREPCRTISSTTYTKQTHREGGKGREDERMGGWVGRNGMRHELPKPSPQWHTSSSKAKPPHNIPKCANLWGTSVQMYESMADILIQIKTSFVRLFCYTNIVMSLI